MVWDQSDIRSLRLRLGWAQSDLARRLGCPVSMVHLWELGEGPPEKQYVDRLEYLKQFVDEASDQVSRQSRAESAIKSMGREQITKDDLPSY